MILSEVIFKAFDYTKAQRFNDEKVNSIQY